MSCVQSLHQRKDTHGKYTCEKMVSIVSHWENVRSTRNSVMSENRSGMARINEADTMLARMQSYRNVSTLLAKMQRGGPFGSSAIDPSSDVCLKGKDVSTHRPLCGC